MAGYRTEIHLIRRRLIALGLLLTQLIDIYNVIRECLDADFGS